MRLLSFFLAVFVFSGCSTMGARSSGLQTRLYEGNYDEVWSAALKALNDYPLRLSNKDTGRITTETVNGPYNDLLFTHPERIELPERFRYSLEFNFAKLANDEDQALTRVRVIKNLERFQDFYTGWIAYPSDSVEEKVLLYRIEHLLKMEQTLAKEMRK